MSPTKCFLAAFVSAVAFCCAAISQTAPGQAEIAPGVALPASGSVAVLDGSSQPARLTVLHATEIKSNMHAGNNFARSMVYANQHHAIELPGQHASVVVSSVTPALYVHLPSDEPELQRSRLSLLMLRVNKENREVMDFSNNVFGGGHKRNLEEIAVTKEDVDGGHWLKMTPEHPLEPGEYAVATLPKDKLMMPDFVYDFSVQARK